jgi:2,4-dienoyl-CoA reductase-like NADH-dependent reductase (Old Yellow Enzyme family)
MAVGQTRAEGESDTSLSRIWEPLQLGPVTLPNRIVMTAMTVGYGEGHLLSDRHIAFYRERALGGVGLIITEQQAGYRISKGSFHMGCSAWEKDAIPRLAALGEAVHEFGAKQFVQLFGTGVHDKGTMVFDEWHPLWGVSSVPSTVHRETPQVMGPAEIRDVVKGFGTAASNVMTAGLDGVEIQGAHGHLVAQFLSPAYNRRTDAYGGSVADRCRFALEVGDEVRSTVSASLTVGLRLSFEEWWPAGITAEQTEEQLEIFAASGLFDYVSISTGGYQAVHKSAPAGTTVPQGFTVPLARRAKAIVGERAKVLTVGRIETLEMAEEIVSSGAADLVGMTRSHVADPHLVRKAREGRQSERVRCVGANVCMRRVWDQRPAACVMNPVAGREAYWGSGTLQTVGAGRKRVLIAGGGPAGLKLAAVAAARGHEVRLHERTDELGGHLNLLKRLPGRSRWVGAVQDFVHPLSTTGVEVSLGEAVDASALDADWCEVIICATGSTWDRSGFSPYRPDRPEGIPGADRDLVWDIEAAIEAALDDPLALGGDVLIVDETAGFLPFGLAGVLAAEGVKVEIISPHMIVGEDLLKTGELAVLVPTLRGKGVSLRPQLFVDEIEEDGVRLYQAFGGPQEGRTPSAVVLSQLRIARDALYHELVAEPGFGDVRRVGDALAPRQLEAIVYEGELCGREL